MMAAKRTANLELNPNNWNDDMPKEEAGLFKCASDDEIGRRVLKKAKRRAIGDGASPVANKAFAGLKGFCSPSLSTDNKPSFDFLNVQHSGDKPAPTSIANGLKNGSLSNNNNDSVSNDGGVTKKSEPTASSSSGGGISVQPQLENAAQTALTKGEGRAEYYRQLRSLNEGVLAWIKQHVDKNAYCVLSPIFIDYDRHVRELDKKYRGTGADSSTTSSARSPRGIGAAKPIVSLSLSSSSSSSSSSSDNANSGSVSQIGSHTLSTTQSSQPFYTRAFDSTDVKNVAPTTVSEDEMYEPPKNEVQEVKEEEAFYSIRCKLFYKKESNFVEKGVGTLYLKSTADDKTQLLIRAETNLGNILLNILLTTKLPTERVGGNNVRLVCVPNPPLDPKSGSDCSKVMEPVTFLVKVKTAEDANQLLLKLDKHKA